MKELERLLGGEVAGVVRIGGERVGNPLGHRHALRFERGDFGRVVGHQADRA